MILRSPWLSLIFGDRVLEFGIFELEALAITRSMKWKGETTSTKLADNKGNTTATTTTTAPASTKMKELTKKITRDRTNSQSIESFVWYTHADVQGASHTYYMQQICLFFCQIAFTHSQSLFRSVLSFVALAFRLVLVGSHSFIRSFFVSWMLLFSLSVASIRC